MTDTLPAHDRAEPQPTPSDDHLPGWGREVQALDVAVYAAIAATPTPTLDRAFTAVSRAADRSKLWTATAAALALAGGHDGRRAAAMPLTTSFPSGHAASAFAFATGVTRELPTVGIPMHAAAAVVAYSRVHTGVHYPLDVIVGAVVGGALSPVATTWLDRRRARRSRRNAR